MTRLRSLPARLSSAPTRLKPPAKEAERFYQSAAWRRLIAARKLDADYFAAKARSRSGERLILDHVIERKDGGDDLDPRNTMWLTFSEHQAKTAEARRRRAQGSR